MKPREGVEAPKESPTEVSGVEVQPEVPVEAVLEGVDGNSEGDPLRLEGVQILDSQAQKASESAENPENGVIVAQPSGFESVPSVPQEAFDTLAAMMKESEAATGVDPQFTTKPIPGREFSDGMSPEQMKELERSVYEDGKSAVPLEDHTWPTYGGIERTAGPADINKTLPLDGKKTYAIGVDVGIGEDRSAAAVVRLGENGAVDELVEMLDLKALGELPTGEYRATVRLAEGYVEGAKQQAEADGISLEDWLTLQLNAYLEQWWMAPGPR